MKNFKKLYSVLFCVVLLYVFMSQPAFAAKIYAPDGRSIEVSDNTVYNWLQLGWYNYPVVYMYAENGDVQVVSKDNIKDWKELGWHESIDDVRVTLYAKDKTIKVYKADVDKYLALGWHKSLSEITTTIYSSKGSAKVYNDEVSSYLKSGWSLTPVMLDNITSYPVKFTKKPDYSYSLEYSLEVTNFNESAYYYSEDDTVYLYYTPEYSGDSNRISLEVQCYDSKNNLLDKVPLYLDEGCAILPGNTSWYKIAQPYQDGYKTGGSFTHCKQVVLYGPKDKTMVCYDAQINKQTAVGWKEKEKLYSLDGRTTEVSPYKVDEYKKVGWYTESGFYYVKLKIEYDKKMASRDWAGAMDVVNNYIYYLYDNVDYQAAKMLRDTAMDKWRSSIKCPLASEVIGFDNSTSKRTIKMKFTNVSYKKIEAFRIKFDCYNIFNEKINSSTLYWEIDDADIYSGGYVNWNLWTYSLSEDVRKIKNVKIYDVVFDDGTMA